MLRAGVSAVVAGVLLATLSGCDQSTAADPDHHRPRYSSTLTEIKPKHATNHLILGKCRPMDAPDHTTVCAETHPLNVKKCRTSHPRHGFVCVDPKGWSASTGHRADGGSAEFWSRHRMQSATPN